MSFSTDMAVNATMNSLIQQITQQTGYSDYAVLFFSILALTGYATNGKLWNKPDPYQYIWYERPQEAMGKDARSKETRNIAQKLEESGKDIVIFWGSQSGTAEGFAHRLARECHRRFKVDALVADLSDYDSDSIALIPISKCAVFIMSTYGEGDPSDNASEIWDWLRTSTKPLPSLRYAAFGLGNSNYKYYNKVVDVLVAKFTARDADLMLPVGKADDANSGTEEDFLEWKERLFAILQNKLGLKEHEQEYEASLKVIEDNSLDLVDLHLGEPVAQATSRKAASQTSAIGALRIKQIRELTTGVSNDRNCLHLELDLSDHAQIKYRTGDHLSVHPVNPSDDVKRLLQVLDLESRKDIPLLITSLDPANKKTKIPSPTTLSALFTNYLEITAPVSRETVRSLVPFATSQTTRSILSTLSSTKEAYATFLLSNHITLSRLLDYTVKQDASHSTTWSHLPISFILESLTPMTPRHYSISSSSTTSPKQVSITVAISPTKLHSDPLILIPGLATSYLSTFHSPSSSASEITSTIHASIRRSTFKLPISPLTPLILIGAGTGIAPLRAFLHERAALSRMGRPTAPIILFYGFRNPNQDYLYRSEIEDMQHTHLKGILEVVTAVSRPDSSDANHQPKGQYVSHLIASSPHSESVARILVEDDGAVFFCGSTKMAKDAGAALLDAVQLHGRFNDGKARSEDEVLAWRDERRRVGRWKEDVWG